MEINLNIKDKNVLIIGHAGTGKTNFVQNIMASYVNLSNHKIIHSDDFISYGFEQSLYVLMEAISKEKSKTIVEGVQGYRLLRKGAELGTYKPDLIIIIKSTKTNEVYKKRGKNIEKMESFNKSLDKIYHDYLKINNKPVETIIINNNY